jgi:ribonuclease E
LAAEAAEDEAAAGRRRRRGRRGRGRHEGQGRSEAERPVAAETERVAVATFEHDDEIDTTPREDPPVVAMEASDLVHEVSEAADAPEGEAEARLLPTPAESGDDDDDEAEPGEIVGQPVALKEGNGDVVAETVESVGSEDVLEEVPERARHRRGRPYKIQEVIRRRQIILVQVVKEERGNKGAALTTYLSLAGRYTVLMPNTARGGGISRKITNPSDRKRLREIAGELEVPEGMGLIIRTAGAQRTKTEIKRDYDYLLRLWENVRDLTLKSTAPALVYEEGSLIKRSIRDLYNKDIDEVLVAGDDAYREAKDFMRMLMPSHAKNVKPYKEPEPVFIGYQVERQLAAMFSPQVVLKSGGYIVINQTEALVSVDVNSGKATREHNIEDTALKTNLEAAEEIARQLRLRDLAGLIVIDFIDMDERRNNRLVERRLKEALRHDRARIQVGRISHFGLLEMSRQRLRTGMLEGSTKPCPMCQGTGMVRSIESVALDILRSVEDRLITDGVVPLVATTAVGVALYILNQKRLHLNDIQQRYRVPITVTADENMHVSQFVIEHAAEGEIADGSAAVHMDWAHHEEGAGAGAAPPPAPMEAEAEPQRSRSRRRRRRRRSEGGGEYQRQAPSAAGEPEEAIDEPIELIAASLVEDVRSAEAREGGAQIRKGPRRRGRRGGRRGRSGQRPQRAPGEETQGDVSPEAQGERGGSIQAEERQNGAGRREREEAPARFEAAPPLETVTRASEAPSPSEAQAESPADPDRPRRRGWWQR